MGNLTNFNWNSILTILKRVSKILIVIFLPIFIVLLFIYYAKGHIFSIVFIKNTSNKPSLTNVVKDWWNWKYKEEQMKKDDFHSIMNYYESETYRYLWFINSLKMYNVHNFEVRYKNKLLIEDKINNWTLDIKKINIESSSYGGFNIVQDYSQFWLWTFNANVIRYGWLAKNVKKEDKDLLLNIQVLHELIHYNVHLWKMSKPELDGYVKNSISFITTMNKYTPEQLWNNYTLLNYLKGRNEESLNRITKHYSWISFWWTKMNDNEEYITYFYTDNWDFWSVISIELLNLNIDTIPSDLKQNIITMKMLNDKMFDIYHK